VKARLDPSAPTNHCSTHYQDYAVAVVRSGDYFTLSHADFPQNALKAGETTQATLTFDVRDGVEKLDELVLEVHRVQGRIHVAFG
jgi:hypothetical protein